MARPLVSIITPTFNHERFIGQCLDSVLSQTFGDWEQIVVDDGSTDQTAAIVAQYAAADSRIHLIKQQNMGMWCLAATYNVALEQACGELVAILEGDDYWPPDKLAKQVSIHTNDTLLSYGDTIMVDRNRKPIRPLKRAPIVGSVNSAAFLRLMLLRQSAIQPVAAMCDARALKAIGGFIQGDFPAADFPTFLRLAQLTGRFVFEPTVLGFWRQHEGQITARSGVSMIEGRLALCLQLLDELPEESQQTIGIRRLEVLLAHRAGLADSYFNVVRAALRERNEEALDTYIPKLWKHGSIKRKLQALYAAIAFRVGIDMELILSVVARLSSR